MRHGSHTISQLSVHLVWITKYRYNVLESTIKERCRELIRQICEAHEVKIVKGVISRDHVHLIVEYSPKLSISNLVKSIKGRTSNIIQSEFPHLKKRYYGKHFWASGFGAWSLGKNSEEKVSQYLEHHKQDAQSEDKTFILED